MELVPTYAHSHCGRLLSRIVAHTGHELTGRKHQLKKNAAKSRGAVLNWNWWERLNITDHGEAREQRRGPAGRLQLGPAQVELPPGQGLHWVVVGADQFQVTAPHPVSVVHPPSIWSSLGDPRRRGAHRHVQLTAHGTWWGEKMKDCPHWLPARQSKLCNFND